MTMLKHIIIESFMDDAYVKRTDLHLDQRVALESIPEDYIHFGYNVDKYGNKVRSRRGTRLNVRRLQKWGYRAIITKRTHHYVDHDLNSYEIVAFRHVSGNTTILATGMDMDYYHEKDLERIFAQGSLQ